MKYVGMFSWSLIVGFGLAFPLSGLAADEQKKEPSQQIVEGQAEKPEAAIATTADQANTPTTVAVIAVYKPPKRGAPGGRVSGGTRGPGSDWH